MSYARFGEGGSDVYVYADYLGYLRCCGCVLQQYEWVDDETAPLGAYMRPVGQIVETQFHTADALEAHLAEHVQAGHCVPESIMPAVRGDWTDVTR